MQARVRCLTLVVSFGLAGCSQVFVNQPIGEPISKETKGDAHKFDGVWEIYGTAVFSKYIEPAEVRLATIHWDEDKKQLVKKELTILLTIHDGKHFMNWQNEKAKDGTPQYEFARYRFVGDHSLEVWLPNANAFAVAIRKGLLKGTVERTSDYSQTVRVTSPKPDLRKFVLAANEKEQFIDPFKFRKLGDPPGAAD